MAYEQNVFINCPFDDNYRDFMHAIVFAVHDCGFVARSALELADSSEIRIRRIMNLIRDCQFGVHDISRTEPDADSGLPRFNMPLELGLFLGAKRFGSGKQKRKNCLILDRERYRYQEFCSDIAGQDIEAHGGVPGDAIPLVRNWLRAATRGSGDIIPGGDRMIERYELFWEDLPDLCRELGLDVGSLIFNDYTTLTVGWLKENAW